MNFDAHSENPLWARTSRRVNGLKIDLEAILVRFNGLELLAWGFNPRWARNAAGRWDVILRRIP
jgi:hypothetical protein